MVDVGGGLVLGYVVMMFFALLFVGGCALLTTTFYLAWSRAVRHWHGVLMGGSQGLECDSTVLRLMSPLSVGVFAIWSLIFLVGTFALAWLLWSPAMGAGIAGGVWVSAVLLSKVFNPSGRHYLPAIREALDLAAIKAERRQSHIEADLCYSLQSSVDELLSAPARIVE